MEKYYFLKNQNNEYDNKIINSIIIACVIGIVIVVALILYNSQDKTGFSELYFENYTKEAFNGEISFDYAIANHEGMNTTYAVIYKSDDMLIGKDRVFIENGQKKSLKKIFGIEQGSHKIIVEFQNNNQTYSIYFWTEEK